MPVDTSGTGYLGGEFPNGRTTINGAPVEADVEVFYELGTGDWQRVANTTSQPDGTWSLVGLDPTKQFNVLARHASFGGVIALGVTPSRTDIVALSGSFTSNADFSGVDGYMTIESGFPPFTVSVLDAMPAGLAPVLIDGRKLIIDGIAAESGERDSTLRIKDSNGIYKDLTLHLVTANPMPKFWRILMTENVWDFGSYGKGLQIAELQFDGAQATGGTPWASSSSESPPDFGLTCAFDGDKSGNSMWSALFSSTAEGEWLGYEFPTARVVNSVSITVRNHPSIANAWSPKSFNVESSTDGINWKTEWSVTGQGVWSSAETRVFNRP